ncbi:hypothetical protein CR513_56331, partial [Mucuna pruriens]
MNLFSQQLTIIFKDVMTNRKFKCASSHEMLPTSLEAKVNDKYCPSLKGISLDVEEDSSDNMDANSCNEIVIENDGQAFEVENDVDFHSKCCNLMLFKGYIGLKIQLKSIIIQ